MLGCKLSIDINYAKNCGKVKKAFIIKIIVSSIHLIKISEDDMLRLLRKNYP
jgi:hypothetical protein